VVIPIVLALFLKLVCQPATRMLERFHVPRVITSIGIIAVMLGAIYVVASLIAGPSRDWANKVPTMLPKVEQRLRVLHKPVEATEQVLRRTEEAVSGGNASKTPAPAPPQSTFARSVFANTGAGLVRLFTTTVLLFFFLMSGDTFLRRFIELLPDFKAKRQVVDIAQQIEVDISVYLFTITAMNAAVGCATAGVMYLLKLGDPIFWGTIAFMLNFIPIFGPTVGVLVFCAVGLLTIDKIPQAFLPALCYFGIHCLEGELITPMLLARRFTLNPVLVVISLLFWTWMWGIVGALLAVPLLASFKIIADRTRPLMAIGHFMGGDQKNPAANVP
jgi:predicted PurR-regulated permease PerM